MEHNLGYGVGLRRSHFNEILSSTSENRELPEWVEVISENFIDYGGKPREVLQILKEREIPIIAHGVGLSLGSLDPFNQDYLKLLKEFTLEYKCPWFTDHLCMSSSNKHQYHDLIPVLRTKETLEQIVDRIKFLEDEFQIPFGFENISYYGESSLHDYSEVDFINNILEKTNSFLLLDINNIYVNSENLKFDAKEYLNQIPVDRVVQIHMAGHYDRGDIIIDTHGAKIIDKVWDLYAYFIKRANKEIATLIEWDNSLPPYEELLGEAKTARKIAHEVLYGK